MNLTWSRCIGMIVLALPLCSTAWATPCDADSDGSLDPAAMIVYKLGTPVPQCALVDLGDPANLGGTMLEGDPKIAARVDYARDGMLAGVFQATRGTALIHFPFTEHATIIYGSVTLTDETGQTKTYHVGDSYFIRQGSVILWEVRGRLVQKSFFNIVETR